MLIEDSTRPSSRSCGRRAPHTACSSLDQFLGRLRRLRSVAAANQLHHAVATADLLAQNAGEIAFARLENVLPDRIVAQEGQRIGN